MSSPLPADLKARELDTAPESFRDKWATAKRDVLTEVKAREQVRVRKREQASFHVDARRLAGRGAR